MPKETTTFMDNFKVAMEDRPKTMDEALQFARTRAWYFVVEKDLVGSPREDAYTRKCIKEAKKKWSHLPA